MIKKCFLFLSVVLLLWACSSVQKNWTKITYGDVEKSSCLKNSEHTYHYALPLDGKTENLPLLVVLDAHGDARAAIEKMTAAANFTPMVVVSSNLIENGVLDYNLLLAELMEEVSLKFHINSEQIILAGFSGGARMAFGYSLQQKVAGLLMIGAGPGGEKPSVPLYTLSGMQDFNLVETYQRPDLAQLKRSEVILDYFFGMHEWPSAELLSDAILFLSKDFDERTKAAANWRAESLLIESDTLLMTSRGLSAFKSLEKAYKLSDESELKDAAEKKCHEVMKSANYRLQITSLENHLNLENQIRQEYIAKSINGSAEYWRNEVNGLVERSYLSSDTRVLDHCARLKGFLGILCYSRLKTMILDDNYQEQSKILLQVFEKLEPENADMFYYKAQFCTKQGQMDSASHFLALSRKYGLKE